MLQRTASQRAYQQAYYHFQQSLELFTQENRQDLVARFIIAQAEILQKLGEMDQLEALAKQALVLHKLYKDLVRQARDHGFLAETALSRSEWAVARQRVNIALQILELAEEALHEADPPNPHLESSLELAQRYHYGWYLFLLARAEKELGNLEAAIRHLEAARDHNHPQNDPPLYIRILRTLRGYYFEKGEYQLAFRTKQLRRLIEHQFGYRAFVGALRLQPQPQQAEVPFIPAQLDQQALMAQEIAASGRQQDVKRLVDRLSLPKDKLVVIHGPSGVGKSSILNAGLVPMLQDKLLGERTAVPILLDVYTDWQGALEKKLATALNNQPIVNSQQLPEDEGTGYGEPRMQEEDLGTRRRGGAGNSQSPIFNLQSSISNLQSSISNLQSPISDSQPFKSPVLQRLQRAIAANLVPVLVFDQFEEFFFVYDTVQARRPFYQFLRGCLNLPFVKVILALREDYLHYLLEFQRLTDLDIINNDILSKDIRYPLGDLSPDDTRVVIRSLTDKAQYYLPDDLIDALVDDLAGDLGEVRPIELQVVGAEIQAEGIATLAEYRQKGPKEKLVQRSLETVVKDCGPENEDLARIILFLLTNENGTRPLKTQDDLEADLVDLGMTHEIDNLDLVLEVLVGSGLVFQIPELPSDRYQLVHDYLVNFIRQEQESDIGRLAAELEKEREQRRLSEARLEQVEQEKRTLAEANRRARKRIWVGSAFLGVSVLTAMLIGISAVQVHRNAESQLKLAQEGTRLEQAGANVLRQFQLEPAEKVTALISAVQIGQRLKSLTVDNLPLERYPATSPLMTLQVILDTLQVQAEGNGKPVQTGKTSFATNQKIITSLVFSPDGQRLATAGKDGTVQISSLSGQPLQQLVTERGAITSLNFSPDGQRLATTGQDGAIQIWSQSGQRIAQFKLPDAIITSLSFSADGKLLVTVNGSGKVELWDWSWQEPEHPQKLREIKHDLASRISSVSVSNDRQRFVTIALNGTVRFWDVLGGRQLDHFDSYQSQPRQVSLSPSGEHVATVGFNGTVRLWNLVGRQVAQFGGKQSKITTVSVSPDGKRLAIAQGNGSIQLQPIRSLDELLTQSCTWLKDYFRTYPEAEEACLSK
ncbi:MAG: hypothetical protein HC866_17055 [Leptolyngbyaceae cyanobacterium RU_5_1]|nr:hypothetical protein [Leptolyngbyaceae cyanobacterium RU_5_1]